MGMRAVLVVVALVVFGLVLPRTADASTPTDTIAWDTGSRQFVTTGGYARVKRIAGGDLLMVYSDGPGVDVRRSHDNGATWSGATVVAQQSGYNYTNAELLQLANGWLVYLWNGRPVADGGAQHYVIMTRISRDGGNTWGDERTAYTGDNVFSNGVWEPSAIQLPSGEVQLFFANESPYRSSDEQEITLLHSYDNGLSWVDPQQVSFRAGHRDGMPVPVVLAGNAGLAFAIEDNGLNGDFKPSIVWSSNAANWSQTSRWGALRADQQLPAAVYAGAPYLVQMPTGETVLSVQSTEGRAQNNLNDANMQVYVGDGTTQNFANRSTPFPDLPAGASALWNSLTVLDNDNLLAVSSVTGLGQNGIWIVRGHIVRGSTGNMIVGAGSGRCVDDAGGGSADGNKVQLYDCHGGPEERWSWQGGSLVNANTGKCLDVSGGRTASGTIVQLWTCLGNAAQQWQLVNGNLRNPNSGKCLDANAWGTANGTQLIIWDCGNGQSNQTWSLRA